MNPLHKAAISSNGLPYGYHLDSPLPGEDERFKFFINLTNVCSYIPILNIISSIAAICIWVKIILDAEKNRKKVPSTIQVQLNQMFASAICSQILRLFFSTLMIIPDIIFTLARNDAPKAVARENAQATRALDKFHAKFSTGNEAITPDLDSLGFNLGEEISTGRGCRKNFIVNALHQLKDSQRREALPEAELIQSIITTDQKQLITVTFGKITDSLIKKIEASEKEISYEVKVSMGEIVEAVIGKINRLLAENQEKESVKDKRRFGFNINEDETEFIDRANFEKWTPLISSIFDALIKQKQIYTYTEPDSAFDFEVQA